MLDGLVLGARSVHVYCPHAVTLWFVALINRWGLDVCAKYEGDPSMESGLHNGWTMTYIIIHVKLL